MLDLNEIITCFMDFDDTICLRVDRTPNNDYLECMFMGDFTIFDRPNRAVGAGIPEFIRSCKNRGIALNVLTYAHSNIIWTAEMKWLRNKFGSNTFNELYICSPREYKIELMKQYSEVTGIERKRILFVDDAVDVVDKAYEEGFSVASPQEIALQYYER